MLSIAEALERIKGRVTDAVPEALIRRLCHEPATAGATATSAPSSPRTCSSARCCTATPPSPTCAASAAWTSPTPPTARPAPACPWNCSNASSGPSPTTCVHDGDDRPEGRWLGHRVFLLDGSSFSMPDTAALRGHFGQPSGQADGCGFPVAHLMALFDARRGYLLRGRRPALEHPRHVPGRRPARRVSGRATCWWATGRSAPTPTWRCAWAAACTACSAPTSGRSSTSAPAAGVAGHEGGQGRPRSRWLRRLGRRDQWVEYFKPKGRPEWMTDDQYAALPDSIVVRELRYAVERPGCRTRVVTLVTTLLDPGGVSGGGAGAAVRAALGRGDGPAASEADDEDGRLAL